MMKQHLFLDLEETLIKNWGNPVLGKKNKVESVINRHFPGYLEKNCPPIPATIWSFAISNVKDSQHFYSTMKKWLEDTYYLNIQAVPTYEEILGLIRKEEHLHYVQLFELGKIYGKAKSLEYWALYHEMKDCDIILLDDTVPNKTVSYHDLNLHFIFERI